MSGLPVCSLTQSLSHSLTGHEEEGIDREEGTGEGLSGPPVINIYTILIILFITSFPILTTVITTSSGNVVWQSGGGDTGGHEGGDGRTITLLPEPASPSLLSVAGIAGFVC